LIAGNNITSSKYMSGIYLVENSDNNLIYGNNILDNSLSFFIRESKDNQIHHNNIVERFQEPWVEEEYRNIWDNGTEGNYWSNYTGTDANHDGIGDTAYIINDGNKDNYPLMTKIDVSTITLEEIGWKQKSPETSQEDQTTPEPSQEDTATPKPAQGTTPTPEASQEDQTTPEPFPTALTAASITAATAISVGLLGYFKKRKR
jgi:parallel beta-helix repeat protein